MTTANRAKKDLLPEESALIELILTSCVDIGFAEKMKKQDRAEGAPVWKGALGESSKAMRLEKGSRGMY